MRNCKLLLVALSTIILTACQTSHTLYDWGGYDEGIYEYYHDPVGAAEFPTLLEAHIEQLEENNQTPGPGLYAEIGTFSLKLGDLPKAIEYYQKEANAWPESKPFMDALVQNLQRQLNQE